MKKMILIVVLAALTVSSNAFAATKYFNGKIERIEVCASNGGNVFLYFKDIAGDAPLVTNGCSNDAAFPFVKLTTTSGTLTEVQKAMMSVALSAQAADRFVRVRYDDENWFLQSIAID